MKRMHLFHSFVYLMTGLETLAFGLVAQADNTTTAESSTSVTMQKIEPKKDVYEIASESPFAPLEI
ncbi:glutamine ABC transporter permease, partial [Enterococcus faecium]